MDDETICHAGLKEWRKHMGSPRRKAFGNDLVSRSRRIEGENLMYNGDALKYMQEGIPGEYLGLDVKSGFGIGNWAF